MSELDELKKDMAAFYADLDNEPHKIIEVCRESFSQTCPIVCILPKGHKLEHLARTKSDSIEYIKWNTH